MTTPGATIDQGVAAQAYDEIAPRYDRIPFENRINAHMRRRSLARLLKEFRPGLHVLEIGCGTGEEALALAARGLRIAATDPSPRMLLIAREKAAARGLGEQIEFFELAARDLSVLLPRYSCAFDGAYASFSLAYEPDIAPVVSALHELLRPRALLVASVPSRIDLLEWAVAMATGHPWYAGRRLRPWHGHKVGSRSPRIRTYTPRILRDALAPYFTIERMEGVAVVVPPPYTNEVYSRVGPIADAFESIDEHIASWPLFRCVGDHLLVVARQSGRTPNTAVRNRDS